MTIMLRLFVRLCIITFVVVAVLSIAQVSRMYMYLKRIDYTAIHPFTQVNPTAQLNILFLGDSTAVGTGTQSNTQSVAGYFGAHYPTAQIDNFSRNGRKIADLLQEYDFKSERHYQVAVIQIGGNDILRFTSLDAISTDLPVLLNKVSAIADHIVILHSGNVGIAPVFIWPVSDILTNRTKAVRSIYKKIASQFGALYVDLYRERGDDPLNKNIDLYYSLDYLHPSGNGYHFWYDRIQAKLTEAGVNL